MLVHDILTCYMQLNIAPAYGRVSAQTDFVFDILADR
jgi:hypothetical protein